MSRIKLELLISILLLLGTFNIQAQQSSQESKNQRDSLKIDTLISPVPQVIKIRGMNNTGIKSTHSYTDSTYYKQESFPWIVNKSYDYAAPRKKEKYGIFLEATHATNSNCMNGSIDLTINSGVSPYEVQWHRDEQLLRARDITNLDSGREDINNLQGSTEGIEYRLILSDGLCGHYETTIKVYCEN